MFVMDTRIGSVYPVQNQPAMEILGGSLTGVAAGDYIAIGNSAGGSSTSGFGATTYSPFVVDRSKMKS